MNLPPRPSDLTLSSDPGRPSPCGPGESFFERAGMMTRSLLAPVAALVLGALWLYKRIFSPALHLVCGPQCGCRYYPSCSEYATDAVRVHGPFRGAWLALRRLARCNPFHPGGVDFVPPARALRPRCVRAT